MISCTIIFLLSVIIALLIKIHSDSLIGLCERELIKDKLKREKKS